MPKIDWNALVDFIGYGPNGPIELLFLGLEERADEGERNLAARASFRHVEDLRFAHEHVLASAGCYNPFAESHKNPVQQWNTAARFALALAGSAFWDEHNAWSSYWRNELGRSHGTTFLMECFPYPRRGRSTRLPGAPELTTDEMWLRRLALLRQFVQRNPVQFVVAYGILTKSKAADIFSIDPKAWHSVPGLNKPVDIATNGNTCVAHVGFFGQGLFANRDIPAIVRAMQDVAAEKR